MMLLEQSVSSGGDICGAAHRMVGDQQEEENER